MLSDNLKLWLASVAFVAAVALLVTSPSIQQGTGLVIATLAAGSGWLVKDLIENGRKRRSICQAYAALIEAHFEEISDALSDDELDRLERLAQAIAAGTEPESIGTPVADPFGSLPDIRNDLHLLNPATVRMLEKWKNRGRDLFHVYDKLGTKELSCAGPERLKAHHRWVRLYRDQYCDISYTALLLLKEEDEAITINTRLHEKIGAKRISGGD